MSSTSFDSEEFRRAHERRRLPRLRLPSLAYVDVDSDNGGILLNLSETGLALQAVAPFAGLTRVTLRIQPPKPRKRLDLNAEITWLSESKKEAGVQFLELSDDTRVEIANWISAEGGARERGASGDSAAALPAPVSPAHFPEEAFARRRNWSRSLENSTSQDAPPNQKIPGELPRPALASGNPGLHTSAIIREQSVEIPAPNPDSDIEKIHAISSGSSEQPSDPIVLSGKVSPGEASPSVELPHRVEVPPAPPRRQKWSFLVQNAPAQSPLPIQKTPSEIPGRAVGFTYIERLTDAILRKNSVDVSPKNPIATNEQTHPRTDGSNVQPDISIIHSQNVSDAAQSSSIELPSTPAPSAPTLPLPAAVLNVEPQSAPSTQPIAKPDETPKTFIPSISEDFPRASERRRITRQRICSLAYLEVGADNGGMVLDLSERGLALQAFNPLIGLTRVNLRIQPPKSRRRIAAAAEIIWLSESQTEAGLRFLELSEDARTEIADWISAEAAVPEPPSLEDSTSQKITDVPSAQVSSAQPSSAPSYEGQDRNREEWFPLFGDLNPDESTENQNAFNDSPRTSTDSGTFALQLGFARSETFSGDPAIEPDSSAQAPHERSGDEEIPAPAPPASSAAVSHIRHPPLKSSVSPAAVPQPFLPEQFRKWGTIAVVCTCIALVFLFLGMAISQGLLRDHSARVGAVSSPAPATPPAAVTHDTSSDSAAIPSEPAGARTQRADSEKVSRAAQIEVRDKHSRDNSQPRMLGGETAASAAMAPSTNVRLPDAAKSDAQNTTVPSLPVWSVQAAASHNQPASMPTTNPVPLRVPERRSECYLLYRVEPLYPREAREQRIEGTVTVHLQIGTDGRVKSSRELSGPAPLVPAALAAAREWRFIPALLNGQPIDSEKDVSIEFQLSR
jgi:TonB family protein